MRSAILLLLFTVLANSFAKADPAQQAAEILKATGIKGGFIVHLGCGDGSLTAALKANDSYQVHGLGNDQSKIDLGRADLIAKGIYGPVALEKLSTKRLPYIDNMVNLVVAEDTLGVSAEEIDRVLEPLGVSYIKTHGEWKKTVKPRPLDMDDWTHYLHDPSGNPVAHDKHVGPPENLQWVAGPRWSRHHDRMSSISGMVSEGGRIFYIMDLGSRISIMLPPRWNVVARDAFNGTTLWMKPIPDWQDHLWPLKSGPTQLTRRIVAVGGKVFVTMGRATHVSCLDAATGSVIREYPETSACEEILVDDGQLLALARHGADERDNYKILGGGDQGRVEKEFEWDGKPREIVALDIESGKKLWSKTTVCAPLSLCENEAVVLFHDGDKLVCLDRKTGEQKWASEPASRRSKITFNFGPRLVIWKNVLLYSGGDGKMRGFDAASGKLLWTGEQAPSGYQSPQDVIVAKDLLWGAPTTSGNLSGDFTGRDPLTGEVKASFPPGIETYWFHHRCYISKATDDFIMPSRTGVEFVDLNTQKWDINHWVRGACLYGVMPANGLVYAPPHDCACYPETKLYGLNAMAPKIAVRPKPSLSDSDEGRMEKGPAYDDTFADVEPTTAADWPTYRGDQGRTGFLRSNVGANLAPKWEMKLGGKLSAVSVGEGKVFVAQIDMHTLHALNVKTGAPMWHYTTGGRIDSPPSVWKGRVVFGCADGWVYCLRAKDGALAFRFRGAPNWERHMAFDQLESVWPVSGAVLMEDGVASFIAGRSNFMDGGLRFTKIDVTTGSKLVETSVDDKNPNTGGDFQDSVQTLQMPAGLADILVSDGKFTYMKSQKFAADGSRPDFGVNTGNAIGHSAAQTGEGAHVFAPMGFLDDSWFHRSYWVYGKNFSGGHNGYYQAGKFTPSGRILCVDDSNVYSYARKPQYYKWTTPLEHHLFSAPKEAPKVAESLLAKAMEAGNPRQKKAGNAEAKGKGKGKGKQAAPADDSAFKIAKSDSLSPENTPLTADVWVRAEQPDGVVFAHGAGLNGYGIGLRGGKPTFAVVTEKTRTAIIAPIGLDNDWHHLAGVLEADHSMKLYVDGILAISGKAPTLITKNPNTGLVVGADNLNGVFGDLPSFTGYIDSIRVSHTAAGPEDVKSMAENPSTVAPPSAKTVLALTFDKSDTKDSSGANNNGSSGEGLLFEKGGSGMALHLASDAPKQGPGSVAAQTPAAKMPENGYFVEPHWTKDLPLIARGMALANKTLFVAGPGDVVDEEDALARLSKGDDSIVPALVQQDENLDGKHGAVILAVDGPSGNILSTTQLSSPPVWDGMAAAHGSIFVSTLDGKVVCLSGK